MMTKEKQISFYKDILLIRKFEELVLDLFSKGKLSGTTHAYIGQEANAVGVINNLQPGDKIFTNHRCHGHYLARTRDCNGLLCELMGKKDGMCSGIGGSQHICSSNFFSNGVQGNFIPVAVGTAFSEKYHKTGNIVTAFIGDGTLGEGTVYESFNLMSLLNVPVLVVIENNQYAQTTHISKSLAGSIKKRPESFGIKTTELSSFDVFEIYEKSKNIINEIRISGTPQVLLINTYRFSAHSKGDDVRDISEIKEYMKNDPVELAGKSFNDVEKNKIKGEVEKLLSDAFNFAESSEFPETNYLNEVFRISE